MAKKPGRRYCNGTSKRTKGPCEANAMKGREKCYHHGGKTPRGAALPQFKHGRYSKDLPSRLLADYEQTRSDEKLLEQREEIALVQARINDLIKRVDSGESGHLWNKLQETYQALEDAIRSQEPDDIRLALFEMKQLITRGVNDYRAWQEAGVQVDRKMRLVESERRRAIELQQTATAEQFLAFTSVVQHAILKVIKDTALLSQLQSEFTILFRERGIQLPNGTESAGTVH